SRHPDGARRRVRAAPAAMSEPDQLHEQPPTASSTSRVPSEDKQTSFIRRRVPFLFSVRFGLTAWYAGVLILTIAVTGVALRMLLVRALDQDAEQRLIVAAQEIRAQTSERQGIAENPAGSGRISAVMSPELD